MLWHFVGQLCCFVCCAEIFVSLSESLGSLTDMTNDLLKAQLRDCCHVRVSLPYKQVRTPLEVSLSYGSLLLKGGV